MLPYNYSVAWKITSEGYTPMRALVMDFPKDANALAISDEYMFGPAFLVCPVTTPQATSRAVYLPSGASWVDFWTGETIGGGKMVTANAPLNIMPLYVRAGSIVPMGPVMQYATEKPEDPIELRVYCGADGKFTIYEDEGNNYNYERGKYATIPIFWNEATPTLVIGKRVGKFTGMLKQCTFYIVWVSNNHGIGSSSTEKPDAVIHYSGDAVKISRP
jgi:alpha-D-xyloside xylohydrolase